jgi:hypothetical protein
MEVMLDLETLGTTPGSVILSIGAAAFDLYKGFQGRTFHAHLVLQTQLDIGMSVSGPTIQWWLGQEEMARHAQTTAKRIQPFEALDALGLWLKSTRVRDDEGIWAHGLNFDLPIIEALYFRLNIAPPWSYRAGRDTRTLFGLAGKKMGDFDTANPSAHDALQDAIYQADETAKCFQYLQGQRVQRSAMTEPVPATSGDI